MLSEKALTTGQVADYCRVSHTTVHKWIEGGDLKAYRIPSGHHRILRSNFREFLEHRGMPLDESFFGEAEHSSGKGRPPHGGFPSYADRPVVQQRRLQNRWCPFGQHLNRVVSHSY